MSAAGSVRATSIASATTETVLYDIPSQALESALDSYIALSGAQVFYETALTGGRRSSTLKGRFDSAAALKIILQGTGLMSRRTDADAFTIAPGAADVSGTTKTAIVSNSSFIAALQDGVLAALCGNPQTRPGSYKIALELWIASNGAIQSTALIGSTGDAARDMVVEQALTRARISTPPPGTMPQPFIIAIAARTPNETGDREAR